MTAHEKHHHHPHPPTNTGTRVAGRPLRTQQCADTLRCFHIFSSNPTHIPDTPQPTGGRYW